MINDSQRTLPPPLVFSLGSSIPNASRIKPPCNCCGIQVCCTLILLTFNKVNRRKKITMEKLLCLY